MDKKLKGQTVAILVTDGFEQSEMTEPKKALDQAGAKTVIVSLKKGKVKGWTHTKGVMNSRFFFQQLHFLANA